jgi:hypothetical protein
VVASQRVLWALGTIKSLCLSVLLRSSQRRRLRHSPRVLWGRSISKGAHEPDPKEAAALTASCMYRMVTKHSIFEVLARQGESVLTG